MWTCEEQACDGVCTAWGNSHYETFDGRIYDIEGDCQYMLAKGKQTSKDQFEVIVTVSWMGLFATPAGITAQWRTSTRTFHTSWICSYTSYEVYDEDITSCNLIVIRI